MHDPIDPLSPAWRDLKAGEQPLHSLRANDARILPVLQTYLLGFADQAAALLRAFHAGNRRGLREGVHRLVGSGGSFGYPRISEAAAQCEDAIDRKVSDSDLYSLLNSLVELLRKAYLGLATLKSKHET